MGINIKFILCGSICTDDVLDFVRVRVEEGKGGGPKPNPITRFGSETVHYRHNLSFELKHLLKTFLHVVHILWVEEVETNFAQQLGWRITQQVEDPLIDESEFAVRRMTRDEFYK